MMKLRQNTKIRLTCVTLIISFLIYSCLLIFHEDGLIFTRRSNSINRNDRFTSGGFPYMKSSQQAERSKVAQRFLVENNNNPNIEDLYQRLKVSADSGNNVIIIPTNVAFVDLALNLMCQLRGTGANNVLFWSADAFAHRILLSFGYNSYYNPEFYGTITSEKYHSDKYLLMMFERGNFWQWVVGLGFNLYFIDADVIVLRNPLDLVQQRQHGNHPAVVNSVVDFYAQIDTFLMREALDASHIPDLCAGFFYLKASDKAVKLFTDFKQVFQESKDSEDIDDQIILNKLIHRDLSDNGNSNVYINNRGYPRQDITLQDLKSEKRLVMNFFGLGQVVNGHQVEDLTITGHFPNFQFYHSKSQTSLTNVTAIHLNGFQDKRGLLQSHSMWLLDSQFRCILDRH